MTEQSLSRYLQPLEEEMRAAFPAFPSQLAEMYGMLRYHLGWVDQDFCDVQTDRGKRLRPILCLACCEAVGGDYRTALPMASALEFLHNFSLIHDDIEDDSDRRRHRRTLWSIWGLAQGVNAGDALFAMSGLVISGLVDRGVSLDRVVELERLFDRTSLAICEGQYLDISFESRLDVTEAMYLDMIGRKTSALIAACTEAGALLGGADHDTQEHFRGFGFDLGLAFQLRDDVLGIWGVPDKTGKPLAADIFSRKKSLPFLYAIHNCGHDDLAVLVDAYSKSELSVQDVEVVLRALNSIKAAQHAKQVALSYHDSAVSQLASAGLADSSVASLRDLATELIVEAYWPV